MPNPTLSANKFRLLLDVNNPTVAPAAVAIPSGAELQFNLMVFDSSAGAFSDATTITNWNNINSVVVALQTTNDPHVGETFWFAGIAKAAINTACTAANWTAKTDQQMQIAVPSSLNNIGAAGGTQPLWLCIYAVTTDNPANLILLTAFQVSIFDSGMTPQVGAMYLLGPDQLVHAVTIVKKPDGSLDLSVNQVGVAGPGISAPYLVAPDGTYRTPTLVQLANGLFVINLV